MPRISALPSHSGAPPSASQLVVYDPTEAFDDNKVKQLPANTFALDTELVALEGEHDALRVEFDTLEGEHDALRGEFDTVEGEHDALRIEFNALEVEHDALATSMTPVNTQIATLITSANFFRQELLKVMTLEQTDTLLTSSTITDVFIYDTTKDSDGGAWRTRCQALSWYNEPLNTLTRGTTREFPAVALIVAEDDTVTIYDATVVGCPMWMVFLQDGASSSTDSDLFMLGGDFYNDYTSVHAFNGVMSVCSADGGNILGVKGLYRVSFLTDSCKLYYISSVFGGDFAGTISQRNTPVGFLSSSTVSIINRNIYDVAMTVLDDAPIDPDTLLPVPTIAVATAGNSTYGISIIDDGGVAVYDIGADTAGTAYTSVSFDGSSLSAVRDDGLVYVWDDVSSIAADGVAADASYSATSIPAVLGTATVVGEKAVGSATGLTIIKPDTTTPANGMVARVTESYASGFMKGDIRRAFICDAFGLIKDSYFQNPSAWTAGLGWVVENGAAEHFAGGGYTASLSPSPQVYANIGEEHSITFTLSGRTAGGMSVYVGDTITAAYTSNGTHTYTFTSGSSIIGLEFQPSHDFDGTISKVFWTREDVLTDVAVDTITDRSVKASSLTVVGSLTREPVATGAELQCISGFSELNYLAQDYSADLDFGTGDFFMMGWLKLTNAVVGADMIFSKFVGGAGFGGFHLNAESGEDLRFIVADPTAANDQVYVVDALTVGQWVYVVAQRVSSSLYVYTNGVEVGAQAGSPRDIDSGAAVPLGIGISSEFSSPFDGSLCLLRIGAGSLTDAQITEIYRTELPLFQENAKCTIQGTSNAVAALSYDERYNHLAVGTADGVTLFRDLEVDGYNNAGSVMAVGSLNTGVLIGTTTKAEWDNGDAIVVTIE